jgi:molecular chaperone IbpA
MNYDFSPLFRSAIGFDRMVRLMSNVQDVAAPPAYPPYNIAKTGEDSYRLTVAVAGFSQDDLELTVKDNSLIVAGRVANDTQEELLHRGIAGRAFERRFALADHIVVDGADLKDGLLHVALRRVVPEALKPRRVTIGAAPAVQPTIANDGAAAEKAA